jgi:hypothetical protein
MIIWCPVFLSCPQRQQIDEEAVAPGCQFSDAAPGRFGGNARGETLFQLGSQRRIAQGLLPVHHRRQELVEEMIDTADPTGKVKGQIRSHQGPAQPRPGTDRRIEIGDACYPLGYQMQRLPPQRRLQPVGNMSRHPRAGCVSAARRTSHSVAVHRAADTTIPHVIGLGRVDPHCMAAYCSHCSRRSARPDPTRLIRPRGSG